MYTQTLKNIIEKSKNVVITAHMSPDGDAMGSSLALWHVLMALGKTVYVVVPDEISKQLSFLPGFRSVVIYTRNEARATSLIAAADLIFCLDYNEAARIDRVGEFVERATATKVMIDHHLEPSDLCEVLISHPEKSSTCLLLYQVLCKVGLDHLVQLDAATCLLTGMMTDTGNFSYNSNDPEIYQTVAELMKRGVDRDALVRRLFNTFSESCLRINAYAIYKKMTVWKDYGAAMIWLTRDELNMHHYSRGDTEGLVNRPLAIPGVVYSVFLREEERYIKVSMRSVGDFPCDQICARYFGGGGHLNAAGGEFRGSMAQAIDVLKSILPLCKKQYIDKK